MRAALVNLDDMIMMIYDDDHIFNYEFPQFSKKKPSGSVAASCVFFTTSQALRLRAREDLKQALKATYMNFSDLQDSDN